MKIEGMQYRKVDSIFDGLEKHFEEKYPKTEIVVFYSKGVYRIISDGKLKESLRSITILKLLRDDARLL